MKPAFELLTAVSRGRWGMFLGPRRSRVKCMGSDATDSTET
jgi:hypothetical protein